MKPNVYLVITDLHLSYKNKNNRYDYVNETEGVVHDIIKLIKEYNSQDYNVILLFLGDVIDNSFKDLTKAIYINNLFIYLKTITSAMYFVIGNHEMTYYKDNPYWSLFNEIESKKMLEVLHKTWQPTGLLQIGRVIDELEDGEVIFHFNHYPTYVNNPKKGYYNIGLFHKDIVTRSIIKDMQINNMLDVFEGNPQYVEDTPLIQQYQLCYFGHAHKLYGKWEVGNTQLFYLASLGRPNHSEVKDNFLTRCVPAIIVENGKLKRIVNNSINLKSRSESVKEDVIEKQQINKQLQKENRQYLDLASLHDDPIQNLILKASSSSYATMLLEQMLEYENTPYEDELMKKITSIAYL